MLATMGILGGTFDPIHFGHLRPALDVLQQLGLEQIRLLPSARPPHRQQPHATPEQRVTMLQLAVKNSPKFVVDDRECQREGNSYTIDTLHSLRKDYPNTTLYLMLGTDAFAQIQTWHRWDELLDLAHIIVMQRAGEPLIMPDDMKVWYQQHLAVSGNSYRQAGSIWPVEVTQLAISATDIRHKIAQEMNPQFLLPDAVIQLVGMLGLYK